MALGSLVRMRIVEHWIHFGAFMPCKNANYGMQNNRDLKPTRYQLKSDRSGDGLGIADPNICRNHV